MVGQPRPIPPENRSPPGFANPPLSPRMDNPSRWYVTRSLEFAADGALEYTSRARAQGGKRDTLDSLVVAGPDPRAGLQMRIGWLDTDV